MGMTMGFISDNEETAKEYLDRELQRAVEYLKAVKPVWKDYTAEGGDTGEFGTNPTISGGKAIVLRTETYNQEQFTEVHNYMLSLSDAIKQRGLSTQLFIAQSGITLVVQFE
jgi:hypothetical protein